jgi:8-oxo-dGTP pyrophosphatase MutT (NUDIX family)
MERVHSRITHEGEQISVRIDEFRHEDGSTVKREVVAHPGAVVIVAHDEEVLFMVRQPREAVQEDSLLELPAGKLDEEGETPLECAQRELVEEVGIEASDWKQLKSVYTSPGFTDEQAHIFLATGLTRVDPQPTEGERIEIVEVPLGELDDAIEACEDAESVIGLLMLRQRLRNT